MCSQHLIPISLTIDIKKRNDPKVMQERRRHLFLQNQKLNRNELFMENRCILEVNDKNDDLDENCEQMECSGDSSISHKTIKRHNQYKKQLMLSEWLVSIPERFDTDWYLVLCPIGKRCLVVSHNGVTQCYSKSGHLLNRFVSLLPGGNRNANKYHKENCIIDCIFSQTEQVFYILDVIYWNGSQFYNCETEFRFYWIRTKIESECSSVTKQSKLNKYPFHVLKYFGCSKHQITEAINSQFQFTSHLDGLLFYHKKTHYTPGVTPLVNWLKLNMVPNIFGIPIDNCCEQKME